MRSTERAKLRVVHWRRSRNDGSVDFHFEANGERMKGNVLPASDADGLQRVFEQHVGLKLPEPSGGERVR